MTGFRSGMKSTTTVPTREQEALIFLHFIAVFTPLQTEKIINMAYAGVCRANA